MLPKLSPDKDLFSATARNSSNGMSAQPNFSELFEQLGEFTLSRNARLFISALARENTLLVELFVLYAIRAARQIERLIPPH